MIKTLKNIVYLISTIVILVGGWELLVVISGVPKYILPGPSKVLLALLEYSDVIFINALTTTLEIVLGLLIGTVLGSLAALIIYSNQLLGRWMLPLLVISQAIPVFAIAPLLVLWLGYGIASKVTMATLIIFFPVTASFLDGLRRVDLAWLDLSDTMTAGYRHSWLTKLYYIRVPASLPALASGLRIAAATAPIGAIVGEWVGSSAGLGYLMLHANGRMQIDLMFAALITLALISVCLYFSIDYILRRIIPWQAYQ